MFTKVTAGKKDDIKKSLDSVRLYETAGAIFVDNKQDTLYFLGGGVYKNLELMRVYNSTSPIEVCQTKEVGLVYNQYYLLGLGQIEKFVPRFKTCRDKNFNV